jgi:hypothetical protein
MRPRRRLVPFVVHDRRRLLVSDRRRTRAGAVVNTAVDGIADGQANVEVYLQQHADRGTYSTNSQLRGSCSFDMTYDDSGCAANRELGSASTNRLSTSTGTAMVI